MDILQKIHNEWDGPNNCSASGTQIRFDWAMAIYDHGDWDRSTITPAVQNITPPDNKSIDSRRKHPAEYRCENGTYVHSISKLCIANWLYANNIRFEYERAVFFEKSQKQAHSDFYLPERDVHIEYWGMSNDPAYESYKLWKEANYAENNIRYISLYHTDCGNYYIDDLDIAAMDESFVTAPDKNVFDRILQIAVLFAKHGVTDVHTHCISIDSKTRTVSVSQAKVKW